MLKTLDLSLERDKKSGELLVIMQREVSNGEIVDVKDFDVPYQEFWRSVKQFAIEISDCTDAIAQRSAQLRPQVEVVSLADEIRAVLV